MKTKSYHNKTNALVSAAILSAVALTSSNVYAAGAVGFKPWSSSGNVLDAGHSSISTSETGLKSAYSDNPALLYSSWAHTGDWWTFRNDATASVTVTVSGDSGFSPGVTIWASGAAQFDGGTTGFGSEISNAGWETPHSFNSTGAMGDAGTLWMANGQGGNMIETLGYAISGPSHAAATTGWNETFLTGAHDVSLTNTFENGITGSTSAHLVSLTFNDLAPGWYTVYIGGTDHATAGGAFELTVSAVPEADTWAMLMAGLGLIGWRMRNYQKDSARAIA
jgi:hypothetical protein